MGEGSPSPHSMGLFFRCLVSIGALGQVLLEAGNMPFSLVRRAVLVSRVLIISVMFVMMPTLLRDKIQLSNRFAEAILRYKRLCEVWWAASSTYRSNSARKIFGRRRLAISTRFWSEWGDCRQKMRIFAHSWPSDKSCAGPPEHPTRELRTKNSGC